LQLDLSGWTGGASSNTLIEVDEVVGDFGDINVVGLAGNRDAELVVNYDDDTVVLNITAAGAGSGQVSNSTTGEACSTPLRPARDAPYLAAALALAQGLCLRLRK